MRKNNSDIKKLELHNYAEHGRNVVATQPIDRGQTVLFVPMHLMMTVDRAKKSKIGIELDSSNA